MADIQDLKSWALNKACGFKSHHRHQIEEFPFKIRGIPLFQRRETAPDYM